MSEYIRTIIRQVIYRWHQECKRDEPRRVVPQSPHGSFWKYISHLIFTPVPILTIATIESLVATESDRPIYELVRKACSVLSRFKLFGENTSAPSGVQPYSNSQWQGPTPVATIFLFWKLASGYLHPIHPFSVVSGATWKVFRKSTREPSWTNSVKTCDMEKSSQGGSSQSSPAWDQPATWGPW